MIPSVSHTQIIEYIPPVSYHVIALYNYATHCMWQKRKVYTLTSERKEIESKPVVMKK